MGLTLIAVASAICVLCTQVASYQFHREWEVTNSVAHSRSSLKGLRDDAEDTEEYHNYVLSEIKFWYYPGHWDNDFAELIHLNNTKSLRSSSLRKDLPYKFLIHGFLENGRSTFSSFLTRAYRDKMEDIRLGIDSDPHFKEVNIIAVGWGALTGNQRDRDFQEYHRTVSMMKPVAQRVAEFILCLQREKYISNLNDVHIIGHSLGAHVAGLTGKFVQEWTGEPVGRITGLDPAGPLITDDLHLRKEYGRFVDVIHTDANTTVVKTAENEDFPFSFGSDRQCGHVDFYPNGGSRPFAMLPTHPCFLTGLSLPGVDHVCLHNYAYKFFALSIRRPRGSMLAYQCTDFKYNYGGFSWCRYFNPSAIFGEYVNTNPEVTKPGRYYLTIDFNEELEDTN